MKCPNCGKEAETGAKFCSDCGTELEARVENILDEVSENAGESFQNCSEGDKIEAIYSEQELNEEFSVKIVDKKLKKNLRIKKKYLKLAVVALAAILVVILLVSVLKSCIGKGEDFSSYPLMYETDDESKFIVGGNKEGSVLGDSADVLSESTVRVTYDGKYIFFGTDPEGRKFDLYVRKTSEKTAEGNVKIANGISEYRISPDGSIIFYIRNNDLYRVGRDGKNAVKYGKDVYSFFTSEDFKAVVYTNDDDEVFYSTGVEKNHNHIGDNSYFQYFSRNGKKIIIIEQMMDEDTYKMKYNISFCGTGKNDKPEKLETNVDFYLMDDDWDDEFYFAKKDTLYFKNGRKDAREVKGLDGKPVDLSSAYDGDGESCYYTVTEKKVDDEVEYSLYLLDENKAELVMADFGQEYYDGEKIECVSNYDYDNSEYIETFYLRVDDDELVEIDMPREDGSSVYYDYTDDNLFTVENIDEDSGTGDLMMYRITDKGVDFDNGKKIAEDVMSVNVTYAEFFDDELVIIKHDSDEYSVYSGGKSAVEIDADIEHFAWMHKDGTMIVSADYNSNDATVSLMMVEGKKVTTIAEGVKDYFVVDEKTIYYTNKDGELFLNKGKLGKDKMIDSDVEHIGNLYDYVVWDNEKIENLEYMVPGTFGY